MSISTRLSIRWGTSAASEPTSTLVLTLPRTHLFTDLRLLSSAPTTTLYWAFAGHSTHTGTTATFTHRIDSRNLTDSIDCGEFRTLPDGTVSETGRMRNFESGEVEAYEEIWRDEEGVGEYVGLVRVEGEEMGVAVRVGGWWQVVGMVEGEVRAGRWREEGGGWRKEWGPWEGVPVVGGKEVGELVEWEGGEWRVVEINGV